MSIVNRDKLDKVIKSFSVIGLDPSHLRMFTNRNIQLYIERIDIVKLKDGPDEQANHDKYLKLIRISPSGNYWIRIFFTDDYCLDDPPITDIKFSECQILNNDYILIDKSELDGGFLPAKAYAFEFTDFDKEEISLVNYNDQYIKMQSILNLKDKLPSSNRHKNIVLLYSRSHDHLPLTKISLENGNILNLCKSVCSDPFDDAYEPTLLDSFPVCGAPEVAMFCFPRGIHFKEDYELPKHFRFIMTDEMSSRSYCSCLIFTEEVSDLMGMCMIPAYKPLKKLFYEKAICVTSDYPLYENSRIFLGEIYRIQVSHNKESGSANLEKHISYFIESMVINYNDMVNALSYELGSSTIKYYGQPCYFKEMDYYKDPMLLPIVSTLPLGVLLELFKTILLEGKLVIFSKSCNLLTNVITSILPLFYPFRWPHILIPILPYKMKQFVEAPVPYIIGVNYEIDEKELSDDVIVISLDNGQIIKSPKEVNPDPPKVLTEKMIKRLKKIYANDFKEEFSFFQENFDDVYINLDMIEDADKFKSMDLIESFFEFFLALFKNYDKYFKLGLKLSTSINFNKEAVLKDFNSNNSDCFLARFLETSLFNFFIEDNFSTQEGSKTLQYLIEKLKCRKEVCFPVIEPTPNRIVDPVSKYYDNSSLDTNGLTVLARKLNSSAKFFPKLDPDKYIIGENHRDIYYIPKFIYQKDEWCYDLFRISSKDWAKYVCLLAYEIWVQTSILFMQIHKENVEMINEVFNLIVFLVTDLIKNKKVLPPKNFFNKLIKCFGYLGHRMGSDFKSRVQEFIKLMPTSSQASAYQIYMQCVVSSVLGQAEHSQALNHNSEKVTHSYASGLRSSAIFRRISLNRVTKQSTQPKFVDKPSIQDVAENCQDFLKNSAFICYDYCGNCLSSQDNSAIPNTLEEIMCSFKKCKFISDAFCKNCKAKYTPYLHVLHSQQKTSCEFKSIKLLYVNQLIKEIENILRVKGELSFIPMLTTKYKENEMIFWNILFYFRFFNLPLFVIDQDTKFQCVLKESKEIQSIINDKKRALTLKSAASHKNFSSQASGLDSFKLTTTSGSSSPQNDQSKGTSSKYITISDWDMLLDSEVRKHAIKVKENADKDIPEKQDLGSMIKEFKDLTAASSREFYHENSKQKEKIFLNFKNSTELADKFNSMGKQFFLKGDSSKRK